MTTRVLRHGALGLGVILLLAAAPMRDQPDYESLPPEPAAVEQELATLRGRLVAAIGAAETHVSGIAASAEIRMGASPPIVEIVAYGKGAAHRVIVDAVTGEVRASTVVPRFPGDPVVGEGVETASGLRYFDLVEGAGPAPAGSASQVRVHYTGWLTDGTKFDSSVDRGQPATFVLNKVITGWTEGVGGMKVGGKRKLIIPFALGYGERGSRRGGIPPRATLIFDVELLDIVSD